MWLIIQAIIIGIVEGITEFLPVSSTGHMIIAGNFINFKGAFANLFEIVIQLGAILAIVVLYRERIFNSFKNLKPGEAGFKFWKNIMIAFMPAAVLGFFCKDYIDEYLFNTQTVAIALIIGGLFLYFMEKRYQGQRHTDIDDMTAKEALIVGCFQCLALWPGMSRSSSTIIGAWVGGLSNVAAAEFSFFLALPTMVAASGYSLLKADFTMTGLEIGALIVGFIVSFIVALLVVDGFVSYLKKKPMFIFSYYRIAVGVILLVLSFFKIIQA